jgi:hypothetical protein
MQMAGTWSLLLHLGNPLGAALPLGNMEENNEETLPPPPPPHNLFVEGRRIAMYIMKVTNLSLRGPWKLQCYAWPVAVA